MGYQERQKTLCYFLRASLELKNLIGGLTETNVISFHYFFFFFFRITLFKINFQFHIILLNIEIHIKIILND